MKTLKSLLALGLALLFILSARAGLNVPYANDAATLHLWHFDDATNNQWSGSFATVTDAAPGGITFTNYGLGTNSAGAASGAPPFTNILLVANPAANGAVPGFLNDCLMLTNGWGGTKVYAYCGVTNSTGGYFSDTTQFRNSTSGAFTFEALIYIAGNIFSTSIGSEWEIFCGDNNADSGFTRGWQFRLQPSAAPSLNMNFITASGGSSPNVSPALPLTGPDAVAVGNWYHVAVTYTGNAPTNGDTPCVLSFYWTYLDPNRTNADLLAAYTNAAWGTLGGTPIPAIGGSARRINGVGNGGGLDGMIDEVRVSDIARSSGNLAFNTTVPPTPPHIDRQPPTNTLVGYGQPLSVVALASGSLPLSFQWQMTNGAAGGWTNVPGQTANALAVSAATFGNAGYYRLVVTNQFGATNSAVAQVVVGAKFDELFGTGYNTNGVYDDTLAGSADPHYVLLQSMDASHLGPDAPVWDMTHYPLLQYGGFFANPDGLSAWIGPTYNSGGATYTSPQGTYVYRTTFLLDSVDVSKPATLQGTWWTGNMGTNIALNGHLVGASTTANQQNTGFGFTITNGFVAGVNTLDFYVPTVSPQGSYPENALRVEISGIGQSLPAGVPAIQTQPVSQSVHDGSLGGQSEATFSVVALGRPPLSYQWWADGSPVADATNRSLQFINPTTGGQGTSFSVVISNDSGSVTSQVATLTILTTNQPPVAPAYSFTIYSNTTLNVNLDTLYHAASDADNDPLTITWDAGSTNGGSITQNGILLTYTPVTDAVGADLFNYYVSDGITQTAGPINVNVVPLVAPGVFSVAMAGGTIHLTGSGASPGGSFHVLSATNLTVPRTNWTSVATGNFDGAGNFNVPLSVAPAVPQTFYLISVP